MKILIFFLFLKTIWWTGSISRLSFISTSTSFFTYILIKRFIFLLYFLNSRGINLVLICLFSWNVNFSGIVYRRNWAFSLRISWTEGNIKWGYILIRLTFKIWRWISRFIIIDILEEWIGVWVRWFLYRFLNVRYLTIVFLENKWLHGC